ncbi:hypothetical protein B0H10DRAFT_1972395 [Mycena sp. CBHHK59/15]|nr:hypothetical protein B0H10DRAFT_1972395 [Mycena sp. CBHHK59/15]
MQIWASQCAGYDATQATTAEGSANGNENKMPHAAGKRHSTEKYEILRMSEQCQDEDSCKTCQKKTSTVDEQLTVFRSHQGREAVIRALAVARLDTDKEGREIEPEGTGAVLRWGKEERKVTWQRTESQHVGDPISRSLKWTEHSGIKLLRKSP